MDVWTKLLLCYLILANLAGFLMMAIDKRRAKKGRWRISEKALFLCALAGGCLGTTAGMYTFRHKTKHWYFRWGMPILCLLWLALLVVLITRGLLF